MTKTIDTLPEDIYSLFNSGHVPRDDHIEALSKAVAHHITNALAKREARGELRASSIGHPCDRKSWYEVYDADGGEELEPHNYFKFLYGHLIEEVVIFLAKEAGHTVSLEQEVVDINGVKGHTDGVIDGTVVDVKSANSRGMYKFYDNGLTKDDPFSYLTQLNFYYYGLKDRPEVTNQGEIAFVAVDKELGHIVIDKYEAKKESELFNHVIHKQDAVSSSDDIPARGIMPVRDGKSGNMALDTLCRYCDRKNKCWPNLRTFIYSNGPKFLTHVERTPDVPEVFNTHGTQKETDKGGSSK